MKKIQRVAIIGLGALGTIYGDLLTRKLGRDQVFFVADQARIQRYEEQGVYCNGRKCNFRYVDKDCLTEKADLILFAVKYTAMQEALDSVKHLVTDDTLMISVMNGIKSEKDIAAVYGKEKVLYCISAGTDAVKEGNRVFYQNEGFLQLGIEEGGTDQRLQAVTEVLDRARISYQLPEDIIHHLWSKLMLNVGVNQVVAVFETNYGGIQEPGEKREMMIEAMKEVQRVAVHQRVTLADEEIQQWLKVLSQLAPENMPSMRQDTKAGRKTEVELFSGTIRSLGKQFGVPTPVNDFLYERLREMESFGQRVSKE